jgi:hypothetical protein
MIAAHTPRTSRTSFHVSWSLRRSFSVARESSVTRRDKTYTVEELPNGEKHRFKRDDEALFLAESSAARPQRGAERQSDWKQIDEANAKANVRSQVLTCPALHRSAEPNTLAVRIGLETRAELIAAQPSVYYDTGHYVRYPTVLVRLDQIDRRSLRELLARAWRFVSSRPKPSAGGCLRLRGHSRYALEEENLAHGRYIPKMVET